MKRNRIRDLRHAAHTARKAAIRIGMIAATAGAIGGGWLWLTRSPTLAIREIAVEGTNAVRADEIRARLAELAWGGPHSANVISSVSDPDDPRPERDRGAISRVGVPARTARRAEDHPAGAIRL